MGPKAKRFPNREFSPYERELLKENRRLEIAWRVFLPVLVIGLTVGIGGLFFKWTISIVLVSQLLTVIACVSYLIVFGRYYLHYKAPYENIERALKEAEANVKKG